MLPIIIVDNLVNDACRISPREYLNGNLDEFQIGYI